MPSIGATPNWIVARNCPTRDEFACAFVDTSADANLVFRTNGSWGSVTQVSGDVGANPRRKLDLAYESQSGKMLLAYWDDDGGSTNKIGYRTYNGSSLSSEQHLSLPTSISVSFVRLVPDPQSNQILLFALNAEYDLFACAWSGSSWGSVTLLENDCYGFNVECFDAAWESSGNQAVVVYGEWGSGNPKTRSWNGSSWSSESSMDSIGYTATWVRLASDPNSDEILCAILDDGNDVNMHRWNGSSWSSRQEFEDSASYSDRRQIDIAYEKGGTTAVICYVETGNNSIQYRTWDGSSWSGESDGTSFNAEPRTVQLLTGAATGDVLLATVIADSDIETSEWSGSSFGSSAELNSNGVSQSYLCYMMAGPTASTVTPANIPYFTDFESGVGAEWNTAATDYDADLSTFMGRFSSGSASIQLNTTIGEVYRVKLDVYAIDSWNPASGSTAYDYVSISAGASEIFRHTFSQRTSSFSPTYPNPADVLGEIAFQSGDPAYVDGVYRNVMVTFTATTTVTTLTFADGLDQAIDDESMGFDNVSVELSRFHDVSVAKGFNVQTSTDETYSSSPFWADYDNDGDLDAILGGNSTARRMINNSEGSSFTASTFGSGNERRGAALLDVDNDGDVDFWSGNHNSYYVETCYLNDGSAGFSDAGNLGYSEPNNNEGVAAADVDRDGWCDIVHFSENSNWIGHHQGDPGVSLPSLVGSNDSSEGLNDSGDVGNGDYCSSGDVNNDGYLDFFYHYGTGKLFLSKSSLSFAESANGISITTGNNDKIGSAWGDYDNDGDLDLFVPRHDSGNTGYLWRNDVTWTSPSSGSFTNQTSSAYVIDESGQRSCAWGDYDNDGDLDLYVVTRNQPNRLYANNNDGTFRLVDEGAAIDGDGHDAVFVDYDNDGDLDIAYTREDTTNVLLENRTNNTNYLKVRLIGAGGGGTNVAAVGVRIELWNSAGTVRLGRRDVGVARGFGGTEPFWAHFGGVDPATTYQLKVWFHSRDNSNPLEVSLVPNAVSTTIGSVTIPQMITVTEGDARKRILQWREVPNRT